MAENNASDQDKTEEPTPRRLEKSREEGQVARSRELTTFLILLGGLAALWALGSVLYHRLGRVMEQSFLFERQQAMETEPMMANVFQLGQETLSGMLPFYLFMFCLALVAPALLSGWVISAKAVRPKLSKLNPAKGLKRIFSVQSLIELGKAVAKASLVGTVLVTFLLTKRGEYLGLMEQPVQQALTNALGLAAQAAFLMVLTLIVVVLIDVPFQIWNHTKQLRMTKEEVKREHKEQEGDPHLKGKIRQQQQSMARSRMMTKVPEADVVVTNPTHFAVALQYNDQAMGAPKVVAKGTDKVAQRIRELGDEHEVPRLEAPALARALYFHVDLEQEIPAALYTAVAEVVAWAFQLRRARTDGSLGPPAPDALPVPAALSEPRGRGAPGASGA